MFQRRSRSAHQKSAAKGPGASGGSGPIFRPGARRIVDRQNDHVVRAKIPQQMLSPARTWHTVPVRTGDVLPSMMMSPVPLKKYRRWLQGSM